MKETKLKGKNINLPNLLLLLQTKHKKYIEKLFKFNFYLEQI